MSQSRPGLLGSGTVQAGGESVTGTSWEVLGVVGTALVFPVTF